MVSSSEPMDKWIIPPLHGCFYLTGPTCSGKTQLAIEIAHRLDAEIVSMDSMAIYRGMDIGTAKPTPEERDEAPHHLIDIVEPTESFSVSNYVLAAHKTAEEIKARGKKVLISGGTPLYLKSLIRGLFLGPEANWDFRRSVEEDLAQHGQEALIARLAQVDPLLAHKLHPHDHRRIIRALEVAKLTGRPLSHLQQQFEIPASKADCPVVTLQLDRSWLHERINARVDSMLARGLVEETKQLLAEHQTLGRTAAQAVGYKESIAYLDGKTTEEELSESIKAHSRQLARRQEIWFRGLTELERVEVLPSSEITDLGAEICEQYSIVTNV